MSEVEIPHHAENHGQKKIGILIAVIAVLMAIVSSLGKNAANEMIVEEVKASNGFAWYQSKRQREYLNDLEIRRIDIDMLGTVTGERRIALEKFKSDLLAKNTEYKGENEKINEEAKLSKRLAESSGEKNEALDHAEILMQIAVVLCSLTLLTEQKLFVRLGVLSAVIGTLMAGKAILPHSTTHDSEPQQSSPHASRIPFQPSDFIG